MFIYFARRDLFCFQSRFYFFLTDNLNVALVFGVMLKLVISEKEISGKNNK